MVETDSTDAYTNTSLPSPLAPTIPALWPGATIVCLGAGPSLNALDIRLCRRAKTRQIAVNYSYLLAPHADVLYAADAKFWTWIRDVPDTRLPPRKFSIAAHPLPSTIRSSVVPIAYTGQYGFDSSPSGLRSGGHSGYQAIGLAAHLIGLRGTILLLGYDMHADQNRHHFHGDHTDGTTINYEDKAPRYNQLAAELPRSVVVINCTPGSAIDAFIHMSLRDALSIYAG